MVFFNVYDIYLGFIMCNKKKFFFLDEKYYFIKYYVIYVILLVSFFIGLIKKLLKNIIIYLYTYKIIEKNISIYLEENI